MNIYLVPYTWMRHFAVSLVCAAAGLLAWWVVLLWVVVLSPWFETGWSIDWDGPIWLATIGATVTAASLLAEGSLRRDALLWRWGRAILAGLATAASSVISYWAWTSLVGPAVLGLFFPNAAVDLADHSLVSLRYRLASFAVMGLSAGISALLVRKFQGIVDHIAGGLAAGLAAGLVWFGAGYSPWAITYSDLYLASMAGALTFGAFFGFFAWSVPDSLYAGWLRVLTETRFGRRIPLDGPDGEPRERFLGHFPRGLDLFLPAEDNVAELHISILVDRQQRYRLRGLTIHSTQLNRLLEKVNLKYDPKRPTPFETQLQSEDRIILGPADRTTVVEFIMLPREEQ